MLLGQPIASRAVPASWVTPIAPFLIADNLYYVGSEDLASYLVTTPGGHILINANLESSPVQIRRSVEQLGFRWSDIRILVNSQAHSDHMGGAAQVIRETGAANVVMDGDVPVVESGGRADFVRPSDTVTLYAPTPVDRVLHDRDRVELGGVTLVARKTAGHTRGCTTWTLRSHVPGDPPGRIRDIVIVGGTGFWSEYRFVDARGRPESYPGIARDFHDTFVILRGLHGEVFLGAHGSYFDLAGKRGRYAALGPRVFVDPAGYREFVADSERNFEDARRQQAAAP